MPNILLICLVLISLLLVSYMIWKIYSSAFKYKNFYTMKSDIENIKNSIIKLREEQFNLKNLYNKLEIERKNIIHKLQHNPNFFSKRDDSQDENLKRELENTDYMKKCVLSDLEEKEAAEEMLKMNMDDLIFVFKKLHEPDFFDMVFLNLNNIYTHFYLVIWMLTIMCFFVILKFIWQKISNWKKKN